MQNWAKIGCQEKPFQLSGSCADVDELLLLHMQIHAQSLTKPSSTVPKLNDVLMSRGDCTLLPKGV